MSGTHDPIIPVTHGRALRDLAPDAVYIEYNCGHNDFPGSNEESYWNEIKIFLLRCDIIKDDSP